MNFGKGQFINKQTISHYLRKKVVLLNQKSNPFYEQ